MPIISPSPRTSPKMGKRLGQDFIRSRIYSPVRAAFSTSPSSSSLIVTSAAAQETGLPSEGGGVRARRPGHQVGSRHRWRQAVGRSRFPWRREDIRDGAEMIGRPHPAGSAHAGLHLVEHQQNSVLAQTRASSSKNRFGGRCSRPRLAPARPRWPRFPPPAKWSSATCARCASHIPRRTIPASAQKGSGSSKDRARG
jgi:hypothetical protein